MPSHEPKAVVFDLDDTLYPYEHYRMSAFQSVAAHVAATRRADERAVLAALVDASRGPNRQRELQACAPMFEWPPELVRDLVDVIRGHEPRLVLPVQAASALNALRQARWRIGILTNGDPAVQQRKVDALGLWSAVDTVVYATTCGTGVGKPDPAPFREVASHLDVAPRRVVFVGNDEACDINGSLGVGMRAVLCGAWTRPSAPTRADRIVNHLSEVPAAALALVTGGTSSHAA